MTTFKPGDVVQVVSGGPGMTVAEVEEKGVWCEWFNEKGEHKTELFSPNVLKKI
ncbi:MAG: YodC family protein [Desulfomonilaceae bacterium]